MGGHNNVNIKHFDNFLGGDSSISPHMSSRVKVWRLSNVDTDIRSVKLKNASTIMFPNKVYESNCHLTIPKWILVRNLMYPEHNGGISGFLAQWSRINEKCPRELRKTSVARQQIPMITYSICKYSPNNQIIYLCTQVSGHFIFPCNVFIMIW